MAATYREQAINLLSAAKNHGDLAVRLSSLKQAKEILISMEPSHAAELFSSLNELQSSPDMLIRKSLVELVEELCLKVMELSPILMPVLMALLRDVSSVVVRQSIVSCTHIFCSCLEEMARQFQQFNRVEGWAKELWMWMLKLKDAISNIVSEPGSVGAKLLAIKFLEISVLLFSSDGIDFETSIREAESRHIFNISWVAEDHPVLVPSVLLSEGNKSLHILLDLLQSSNSLCGSLIISVINWFFQLLSMSCGKLTSFLVWSYPPYGFVPELLRQTNGR